VKNLDEWFSRLFDSIAKKFRKRKLTGHSKIFFFQFTYTKMYRMHKLYFPHANKLKTKIILKVL